MNKENIINNNEVKSNINNIKSKEINSKDIENNADNNTKVINSQMNIQMNNSIDNKKKINISEEFKMKLNNITKNDFEYQKILPLIQKGSYLTSLPQSVYNSNNSLKK